MAFSEGNGSVTRVTLFSKAAGLRKRMQHVLIPTLLPPGYITVHIYTQNAV